MICAYMTIQSFTGLCVQPRNLRKSCPYTASTQDSTKKKSLHLGSESAESWGLSSWSTLWLSGVRSWKPWAVDCLWPMNARKSFWAKSLAQARRQLFTNRNCVTRNGESKKPWWRSWTLQKASILCLSLLKRCCTQKTCLTTILIMYLHRTLLCAKLLILSKLET